MRFAGNQAFGIVRQGIFGTGEAVKHREDAAAGPVDDFGLNRTGLYRRDQFLAEHQRLRVLDIKARSRAKGLVDALDPVRMDKAVKAPFAAQDIGQQDAVLAAILAVHLVIGTHHAGDAGVEHHLEMWQVDFVQGPLIDPDIDGEAGVLHRIERKMFDRGADVVRLDAAPQRRPHGAQMVAVFAIGFLRPAPARVAQQVDADGPRQVAALRARLDRHGLADPGLEFGVEARPARHRAGKAGGIAPRHPARAIGEPERRNAQPFDPAAGAIGAGTKAAAILAERLEEAAAGHHADLLDQGRLGQDCVDRCSNLGRSHPLARPKVGRDSHFSGRGSAAGPGSAPG